MVSPMLEPRRRPDYVEGPGPGTRFRVILGIETSCDETAAALLTQNGRVLANVVSSQAELHARYGGVVPEGASRHHLELILPALRQALSDAGAELGDVEAVGVTHGAGLLGGGGHTLLLDVRDRGTFEVIGTTLDDAAGEAFDKGARLLGLGYPGGAEIDRLAREGDPEAFAFPIARLPGLDFSFSGVKTSLLYTVRDLGESAQARRA